MTDSFSFDTLEKQYEQYVDDPQYVYKGCRDDVIVILQKLEETVTNETRKTVCYPEYASFRGDTFMVACIFKIYDAKTELTEAASYYDKKFKDITGEIVKSKFDLDDDDNSNASGIHYYKSLKRATVQFSKNPANYTGTRPFYRECGGTKYYVKYKNGIVCDSWYELKYVEKPVLYNSETFYVGSYKNNCIEGVHDEKYSNKRQRIVYNSETP
jgi:hypothetical protein